MATVSAHKHWTPHVTLLSIVNVAGVCYAAFSMVHVFGTVDGGNREPESVSQHLAFLVAAGIGAMFGAAALTNMRLAKKTTWTNIRSVWIVSAIYGVGFCPLVFWYQDWPYRTDRVFGVAFAIALLSDMLSTTVPPILRSALPGLVAAVLRVKESDDAKQPGQKRADQSADSGGDMR